MSGSKSSAPDASARAEPLGMTVHSMPDPGLMSTDASRVRRGRLKMLLVLLVCALPVAASYFTYFVIRPTGSSTNYSQLIQPSVSLPSVLARELDGQAVPLRSLKGQWLLVVVGDSRCDPACEKRLFMQRQLREMMGRERDRIDKVWLITDDAAPSPALLDALRATPAMRLLRVQRSDVAAWLKPAEGQALEDHLYIVDPMGEWMMRAPANADPSKLKRDVERLLRGSASWDQPGR